METGKGEAETQRKRLERRYTHGGGIRMAKEADTIISASKLGKRLSSIHKTEGYQLSCNGTVIPLVVQISIGRGPDNTIVLDDSLVSRQHARIQKIKDAYFITDLSSSNGTFVNGAQVPEGKYVKLSKKDVIVLGRTELRVF